jgi:transcription termination factor Rho
VTDTIDPAVNASTSGGSGISALRLPELQAMAAQLGVKGTSKMRKGDLVAAISAARGGGSSRTAALEPRRAETVAVAEPVAPAPARGEAEQAPAANGERAEGGRRRAAEQNQALAGLEAALDARMDRGEQPATANGQGGERRSRRAGRGQGAPVAVEEHDGGDRTERADQQQASQSQGQQNREQGQQRQDRQQGGRQPNQNQGQAQAQGQGQQNREQGQQAGGNRDFQEDGEDRGGRRRRSRDRYRDRDRKRGRGGRPGTDIASLDEIEVAEDDVLLPVAGILDVLDSYAFVRTSGYLPGPNDVYVSLGQVKKHGLRRGDAVTGAVRQPREGEQQQPQQQQGGRPNKFNALVRLDTVNGADPDEARTRPEFSKLTPLYPQERLRLEGDPTRLTPRIIDIVAPIGKGQRGLIVAPPKAGKTIMMQQIANAITRNNPEVHLMVVLVDERPEEVTDMERTVKGEVIASTFDRPASDHTIVAELAIERAKRLVELGQDVVVLLDSLTRLSRAYNLAAPASGRILSGGVDAAALYPPKKFFGAARNIEHGGSLTIIASALVETGSKMDDIIFEEFKGTGNMELKLSRQLADKRIFPAVDVNASGTRREEILMSNDELKIIYKLRRVMGALDQQQAIELLIGKLKETHTNVEFLLQVQKTTPAGLFGEDAGRTV